MARPVIALLTDFGLIDHYVAAMKGVMIGVCPDLTFIDISHDVPPQDILAGALALEAVAPYLPAGAVVLGVVDPGVGSGRRGVALAARGLRFVGPDNGLFSLVGSPSDAVELRATAFARPACSRTFEGRDRFAPAAAWIASGVELSQLGPPVAGLVDLEIPRATSSGGVIDGCVLVIDRFGNLITNIDRGMLAGIAGAANVEIGGVTIEQLSATYAEAPRGGLCALVGSTERLEIAVNGGNAAATLGGTRGMRVQVRGRNPRDTMPGTA